MIIRDAHGRHLDVGPAAGNGKGVGEGRTSLIDGLPEATPTAAPAPAHRQAWVRHAPAPAAMRTIVTAPGRQDLLRGDGPKLCDPPAAGKALVSWVATALITGTCVVCREDGAELARAGGGVRPICESCVEAGHRVPRVIAAARVRLSHRDHMRRVRAVAEGRPDE